MFLDRERLPPQAWQVENCHLLETVVGAWGRNVTAVKSWPLSPLGGRRASYPPGIRKRLRRGASQSPQRSRAAFPAGRILASSAIPTPGLCRPTARERFAVSFQLLGFLVFFFEILVFIWSQLFNQNFRCRAQRERTQPERLQTHEGEEPGSGAGGPASLPSPAAAWPRVLPTLLDLPR